MDVHTDTPAEKVYKNQNQVYQEINPVAPDYVFIIIMLYKSTHY